MVLGRRYPSIILMALVLTVVGIKTFAPRLFDRSIVRNESFSVKVPEGWHVKKTRTDVTVTAPETDDLTEMPVAVFSVYAEKQKGALFMEDFWPEILASLGRENGEILSTGEELIDGQASHWVLFRYYRPEIAVVSLYIADDFNRLTIIRFVGSLKKFKDYGKLFNEFKKSIRLKSFM
jgi:hypothetical protein